MAIQKKEQEENIFFVPNDKNDDTDSKRNNHKESKKVKKYLEKLNKKTDLFLNKVGTVPEQIEKEIEIATEKYQIEQFVMIGFLLFLALFLIFSYITSYNFYNSANYELIKNNLTDYSSTGFIMFFTPAVAFALCFFLTMMINDFKIFKWEKKIKSKIKDVRSNVLYKNLCLKGADVNVVEEFILSKNLSKDESSQFILYLLDKFFNDKKVSFKDNLKFFFKDYKFYNNYIEKWSDTKKEKIETSMLQLEKEYEKFKNEIKE